MKTALIALTDHGEALGNRISVHFQGMIDLYLLGKSRQRNGKWKAFAGKLVNLNKQLLFQYDLLIYIMPIDVVVRSFSGVLQPNKPGPDVLVVDEEGKFVISLLCGHLEECNIATEKIAQLIGGTSVITDTVQICPNLNLELLAKQLHCQIIHQENFPQIQEIIVNNQRIDIFTNIALSLTPCDHLRIFPLSHFSYRGYTKAQGLIFITNRVIPPPDKPYLILVPKNVLVGVNCSKWADRGNVIKAVWLALEEQRIDIQSLNYLVVEASKSQWPVLQDVSRDLGIPLLGVEKEKIREFQRGWANAFLEIVGQGQTSEYLVLAAKQNTKLISPRRRIAGVEIAIGEINLSLENGF